MILLVDIGNTNTHIGLADGRRVRRRVDLPTAGFLDGTAARRLLTFVGRNQLTRAALCSVVPRATPAVRRMIRTMWHLRATELTPQTLREVGIDYPRPDSIGADRLANAAAAHHHFGAPVVVVDFGTAVTFDVVDRRGNYVGGIIAPGLAAMTDYLHERTALLPRLKIREPGSIIGRSTRQAMLIGAVHGYRGLIRELILRLRHELRTARLPVVATGTYARLLAAKLPEITRVEPYLTLEGLRLIFQQEPAGVSRR
ncbi:MAG TPA: type III pantothenate kinase [Verrucomicrobiota bacterium]|nr:type III pantothenate kinase [Verrucomicrobiota bacterium]HNT16188.1 type III pantothenate kinase [Verrucomicrobiota bacterium]